MSGLAKEVDWLWYRAAQHEEDARVFGRDAWQGQPFPEQGAAKAAASRRSAQRCRTQILVLLAESGSPVVELPPEPTKVYETPERWYAEYALTPTAAGRPRYYGADFGSEPGRAVYSRPR